ncbi:MAG: purine-binding chemotaxis protein CheW [Synechococcales cyanobacterium RU_4_20]|nr:purine-binding chemotaxis protein CheW [Synechococcales cyanobacterium RU_4_20]NJR67498.1 purine-binding chemotaxis protein CheW [Synechococcales cyanobacterium CRU_2_2]
MTGSRNPDYLMGEGVNQSSEIQELETPEGELHLCFYTPSGEEFALPAIGIREALFQSPEGITPIPNVSPLLLGTLNARGRVIWVADLGQFLGEPTVLNTDRSELHVIAIEEQEIMLGLAIDRVIGMAWLSPEELKLAKNIPDNMAPFIRGEWVLSGEEGERRLRLLDQVAILRSARWAM